MSRKDTRAIQSHGDQIAVRAVLIDADDTEPIFIANRKQVTVWAFPEPDPISGSTVAPFTLQLLVSPDGVNFTPSSLSLNSSKLVGALPEIPCHSCILKLSLPATKTRKVTVQVIGE
jgi:hypothetical protein